MEVKHSVVASDGKTYEVAIRGNLYVVRSDGDVVFTRSRPIVAGAGISDDEATLRFATEDIEALIHQRRGGG